MVVASNSSLLIQAPGKSANRTAKSFPDLDDSNTGWRNRKQVFELCSRLRRQSTGRKSPQASPSLPLPEKNDSRQPYTQGNNDVMTAIHADYAAANNNEQVPYSLLMTRSVAEFSYCANSGAGERSNPVSSLSVGERLGVSASKRKVLSQSTNLRAD